MTRTADTGQERSSRSMVAVSKGVRDRARELSEIASQYGWTALGVHRNDPPTIGAIFEEAINLLAARARKKRARK